MLKNIRVLIFVVVGYQRKFEIFPIYSSVSMCVCMYVCVLNIAVVCYITSSSCPLSQEHQDQTEQAVPPSCRQQWHPLSPAHCSRLRPHPGLLQRDKGRLRGSPSGPAADLRVHGAAVCQWGAAGRACDHPHQGISRGPFQVSFFALLLCLIL